MTDVLLVEDNRELADVIKTEGRCERFYKIYKSNCEAVGKNPRPLFVLYREI